jgi:hypothetical protein
MHLSARVLLLNLCCLLLCSTNIRAAELTVERTPHGAAVKLNGVLFTEYVTDTGPKPYLWPIVGPTDKRMTRSFPMEKVPGDQADHPHHRSMWYINDNVNGVNFWAGDDGRITHREFIKIAGGAEAVIVARNDWLAGNGKRQLEDVRTLTFRADADTRTIDFDITLTAPDGPAHFADVNHGGGLALRIPSEMVAELAVKHVKEEPGSTELVPSDTPLPKHLAGHIINDKGQENWDALGREAAWVDYSGHVGDEVLGIAMMNHPASFRFPCHWAPRLYGLFCACPFGSRGFRDPAAPDASYTLEKGKSITLMFRVLFHRGNEKNAKIAEAFDQYAKEPKPN